MYSTTVAPGHASHATDHEELQLTAGWGELFWIAFEESTTAMCVSRDDHLVVAVNRAFGDLTGYSPRELVGHHGQVLVPGNWRKVHERDTEALSEVGTLDERRELLHSKGLRLRVRLIARHVPLPSKSLILWMALADDSAATPPPASVMAPSLTARELEVISGLARGLRIREIAVRLGISPTTVTTHVRNATAKLRARSRTHLVGMALAQELIDPNLVLDEVGSWE